jgi:rhodanese-related sulfurtransferase
MRLGGSITVRELEQRAASLPKDQEIIFYCA